MRAAFQFFLAKKFEKHLTNINVVSINYPGRMSLIEIIRNLNTTPRNEEEEYENTSDFLEWFYYHIYRKQGFVMFPILYQVTKDSSYESIEKQCKHLIDTNNRKQTNTDNLTQNYENMKQWLIDTLIKYGTV